MSGILRPEIEVAGEDCGRRLRRGVEWAPLGGGKSRIGRALARLVVQRAQAQRLRAALDVGVVVEMRRRHAQRTHRRLQGWPRPQRAASTPCPGPAGQGSAWRRAESTPVARIDGVAEAAPAPVIPRDIHGDAFDPMKPRKQRRELGELVAIVIAFQARKLSASSCTHRHVEVRPSRGCRLDDAREIDAAVESASPLERSR
jgi:hypothetical protein